MEAEHYRHFQCKIYIFQFIIFLMPGAIFLIAEFCLILHCIEKTTEPTGRIFDLFKQKQEFMGRNERLWWTVFAARWPLTVCGFGITNNIYWTLCVHIYRACKLCFGSFFKCFTYFCPGQWENCRDCLVSIFFVVVVVCLNFVFLFHTFQIWHFGLKEHFRKI